MNLTPRRRAMLRYLLTHGACSWMDVVRVDGEVDGRFIQVQHEAMTSGHERDLAMMRHAGYCGRVRKIIDGQTRYLFALHPAGKVALDAPIPADDRLQQAEIPLGDFWATLPGKP